MRILVSSRQNRGSRFSIVLPQMGVVERMPLLPVSAQQKSDVHGFSIIVLDDDPLIVAALCRDLQDRGNTAHGFERAGDAEAALLNGLAVDAAILDFDLRDREDRA